MKKDSDLKWSDLKKSLQKSDQKELLSVIQELYKLSEDNRRYLLARFIDKSKISRVMEEYREIVVNEFFPKKGYGELRYSVAEKAISEYSEGSGDLAGTMELMLFFVENVVEFINEYGDIDEEFYDVGYEMLGKFCELIKTPDGQSFYPHFKTRLLKLRSESDDFGYGFGDDIAIFVEDVEDFFEEQK